MRSTKRAFAPGAALLAGIRLQVGCGAGGQTGSPPPDEPAEVADVGGKPHADAAAAQKDAAAPPADRVNADTAEPVADPDAAPGADGPVAAPDVTAAIDAGARPDLPAMQGPGKRIEHKVAPSTTDPAIDKWPDQHYAVLDTRVPPVGKLYVFLAGGNGAPSSTVDMLDFAAGRGLHALGPSFTTDILVADVCPKDPDPNCSGNVRKEVLEGMDLSPHLVVTPANSLDNRITKLLAYLDKTFPVEGWGVYLDGGPGGQGVRWSEVIVAGRSLGASEAACVGVRRPVFRVEMHSGPGDSRLEMHKESAPWLKEPSLTPGERFYGFSNTGDPGHADQLRAWAALGLPGAPISIDTAKPPYGGSHQLITSYGPAGSAHGSTTASKSTNVLPDGSYRFAPVWITMMGY